MYFRIRKLSEIKNGKHLPICCRTILLTNHKLRITGEDQSLCKTNFTSIKNIYAESWEF